MDWDSNMDNLNQHQQSLEECIRVLKTEWNKVSPDESILPVDVTPERILSGIADGSLHLGALPIAIGIGQIEFNGLSSVNAYGLGSSESGTP